MKVRKWQISKLSIILLVALIAVSSVLGAILYTLTVPSTWKVKVSLGLRLEWLNGSEITSLNWEVEANGIENYTLRLRNLSNKPVNVTMHMPEPTSEYEFLTNFENCTLEKGGYVEFWLALHDLGMDSSKTYSGSFEWLIVDSFKSGNEEPQKVRFEPTSVFYGSDIANYLQFVSESFNATEYMPNEPIEWSFTTKNINQSYTIDSFSYKVELFKGTEFIEEIFSGMHDCEPDLAPNEEITLTHTFSVAEVGNYTLHLTYTGHNSEPIPENPKITVEWNDFGGFVVKYNGIEVSSPYVFEFEPISQGSSVSSEIFEFHHDGSQGRFIYVTLVDIQGIPEGYEVKAYLVVENSEWQKGESREIDSMGESLKWQIKVINVNGDPNADFSNCKIIFEVSS